MENPYNLRCEKGLAIVSVLQATGLDGKAERMRLITLSQRWMLHTNLKHTEYPPIETDASCGCGIMEKHRHCGVCGNLHSVGDFTSRKNRAQTNGKGKRRWSGEERKGK